MFKKTRLLKNITNLTLPGRLENMAFAVEPVFHAELNQAASPFKTCQTAKQACLTRPGWPKELIPSDSHKTLIDNALNNKKARNPQIKSRTLLIPLKLDALVLEYAKATEVPYTSAALDLIQRGLKARFPGHSSQLSPLIS